MRSRILGFLVVLLLPLAAAVGDEDEARIVTSFSKAAQCIAPVQVRKIDGKEATVQSMGFNLEPGTHTLTGSAIIDASSCSTLSRSSRTPKIEPLEADFVAGKVYYIGYDHSSRDRNEWKLVIWKVEDPKG